MLTQARLKELLSYDPETGIWTRLVNRPGRGAKAGDNPNNQGGSGYIEFCVDGKNYRSNRLAWLYMTGEWPPALVDHKDLNRTNNRWSNLRIATHSQNKANGRAYANNGRGVKGVSINKWMKLRPYRVRIQVNGKPIELGHFATLEEAGAAYASAAEKYYGEFARAA